MWTPYAFKQTLDERRAGELRNFLRVLQDIPFVEAPVSSIIRSFLPLPFTNHTELSLVVMFLNIQAIHKKFSLTTALINDFMVKWFGPPHFKQHFSQAGH